MLPVVNRHPGMRAHSFALRCVVLAFVLSPGNNYVRKSHFFVAHRSASHHCILLFKAKTNQGFIGAYGREKKKLWMIPLQDNNKVKGEQNS